MRWRRRKHIPGPVLTNQFYVNYLFSLEPIFVSVTIFFFYKLDFDPLFLRIFYSASFVDRFKV